MDFLHLIPTKIACERGTHKGNIMYQVIGYYTECCEYFFFFESMPEWCFSALCVLFGTAHELNFPAGHVAHLPKLQLE